MNRQEVGVVRIGNAKGKIAVYCDEQEAWDMHDSLHSDDTFRKDIVEAILEAYPPESEEEDCRPQLKIGIFFQ